MHLKLASNILGGKINFPLTLAPMVGLSHVALRLLLREYLPEDAVTLWPTEMLNSRRIPSEDLNQTPAALRAESETELIPQILGNEEEPIATSVKKLQEWGAEGIDINMGCPVQKALKHNYGVALMGDPDYAAEVVKMTTRNTSLPVSVKLRAGQQGNFEYLLSFCRGLEKAGACWVTLHPRTAEQKRRGSADWEQIRNLKAELSIPVIGNGDIQTDADVLKMLKTTQCDMVMAGRALAAKPWMLWQVGEALGFAPPKNKSGQAPRGAMAEGAEYGRSLLRLLDLLSIYFAEDLVLRKFRFHVKTTCVWLPFGHHLYSLTTQAKNTQQMRGVLAKFFEAEIEMSATTDLRQ